MQECKGADKKFLDLIWVDTQVCGPLSQKNSIETVPGNARRRNNCTIQRALLGSQLFSAMPLLEAVKAFVSILMSVGWSSKGTPPKEQPRD